jgi:hypothetical protein
MRVVYPLEALASLDQARWQVEVDLSHLKMTIDMDVMRCETVADVSKDLLMCTLIYNLVRRVMLEASRRQRVEVDRISFMDAPRWLAKARPGEVLPKLVVNPDRTDRVEPRVRKRRPTQYPLMTKPRSELRKALGNEAGIVLEALAPRALRDIMGKITPDLDAHASSRLRAIPIPVSASLGSPRRGIPPLRSRSHGLRSIAPWTPRQRLQRPRLPGRPRRPKLPGRPRPQSQGRRRAARGRDACSSAWWSCA